PIDLGLLTGQHGQTKEGLVTRSGSHLPDVPPNGVDAARVAAVAQHFEQSCRSQAWVLSQRLPHKLAVWLEQSCTPQVGTPHEASWLDGELYRFVMKAEGADDGADLPVLGEEEPANVRALLVADHRATSRVTRRSDLESCRGHQGGRADAVRWRGPKRRCTERLCLPREHRDRGWSRTNLPDFPHTAQRGPEAPATGLPLPATLRAPVGALAPSLTVL